MQHSERCCRQTNISINLQNEKEADNEKHAKGVPSQERRGVQCRGGEGGQGNQAKPKPKEAKQIPDQCQTDKQTERQTEGQIERQTEGQTEV